MERHDDKMKLDEDCLINETNEEINEDELESVDGEYSDKSMIRPFERGLMIFGDIILVVGIITFFIMAFSITTTTSGEYSDSTLNVSGIFITVFTLLFSIVTRLFIHLLVELSMNVRNMIISIWK